MVRQLQPALQYSEGRSFNWSGAVLVNAYAEKADGDKLQDFALVLSPGLVAWATVGVGPIRGAVTVSGVLYVVSGNSLYSVSSAGAGTVLGTIPGTGQVSIAENYTQVSIAAGGVGYVWSGGTLQTPVPFAVSGVLYADGYMLWTIKDSEQFIISSLDNALVYDGLDIGSAEGFPDNIVGAVNDHREIQFYGQSTTEIFYNSGAAAFPFQRQGNAYIERGCFDRDSIVKVDNSVTFVGDDRIVYSLNGYIPQRVSTHTIEYFLRDATYARGWTYTLEGHKFYVLEIDRGTFLYDHATGTWHRRKSYGSTFWRCNGRVNAYGMDLLTDRATGALYTATMDANTENGDPIHVEIILPTIENGRERASMFSFEVTIETGTGNSTVADPQIMLQYSDDGGHRWSNEMWRSAGKVGEYKTRAIWRKLGQFRVRDMKLRLTDPHYRLVISYWADLGE